MNSMNVKKIDQEVRYQEWATIIKECRSSGMHVKEWCEMKGIKYNVIFQLSIEEI